MHVKLKFHSLHQSRHHQLKLPLRITQYNVVQITLLRAVTICVLLMSTPDDFVPSCLHTTVASSLLHQLYMSDTVLQTPSIQISTLLSLSICPPTRQRFPDLHSECEVMFPWQIIHCTCYWASEMFKPNFNWCMRWLCVDELPS